MYGIDVSSFQKGLNLKSTGAEFVICKATDGIRFVDSCCDNFIQEAKRNGQLFGFYHFANGLHKSSMAAQAKYFVDNCKGYFGYGVPFLDWEDSKEEYGGAVLKYGASAAKEWLDEVYRLTGVRPIVYMSAYVSHAYDWSEVAKDYALWGAGYYGNSTYDNPHTNEYNWGAFKYPAIHQYTSAGGLDKNIAYMDKEAWGKFARCDGTPTVQVPTKKPTTSNTATANHGNAYVKKAQAFMNNWIGAGLKEDGLRGYYTNRAVIKLLQHCMNLDYGAGLREDGIRGYYTNKALGRHYVIPGETQYMVTFVEIALYALGYNPKGIEVPGMFGSGLTAAVKQFQKDNGLDVDGKVGYYTYRKLISYFG